MKILLFGVLTEAAGSDSIEIESCGSVSELKSKIENDFPELSNFSYRISVNSELVREDCIISADDEIAILPPFSGG